ncbi:MAG: protease modulator HflC [Treponema sp.]|jgi:membrane protease subunit HflC|nr:protease modulator HflC [Treponema sp.]
MKKTFTMAIVIAVVVIGIIVAGPLFVIEEGEQAVIVQMGKLVRIVTNAGLHLKTPFIDEVVRYPKKIMAWDGEQTSIPTKEKQYIWVDVTARWRIADPQKFYEAVSTIERAYSKLAEVIDSEVKTVTAENYFRESVRNSNIIMARASTVDDLGISDEIDPSVIQSSIRPDTNYEPIEKGRRRIAEEILGRSRRLVPEFGIELIDVVIRQIRYSDDLTPSVYARMIKERNQIAQAIRSEGEGRKAALLGRMDNERMEIRSAAYNRAETVRGEADAEAAKIYAEAYNRDRSFFDFWRAIESYRQTMPKLDKTLTTDMEYFRYLYSPR